MFLAEKLNVPLYIPHISSSLALDEVRGWRNRYDRIYAETCPHYLTHTADSGLAGLGKANPPLRTEDDVEALWQGLADGTIDVVASDHVPRKRSTKEKPIPEASQGFPGTATILPVLLHYGYHQNRLSLPKISALLTQTPARIFNLSSRKGNFSVGKDADLTFVDLDLEKEVNPNALGSYSDYSLYEGQKLKGWPVRTIVRGKTVMKDGEITGEGGHGLYLKRS
jgi:dihydropyrimidinase